MTGIAKHLARNLDVRTGVHVESVASVDGVWNVKTDADATWRASSLVLTSPVPQSLALIEAGGYALDAETAAHLAPIAYDRASP
jgi:predicted NAD/FAD-dependent oxidoreductase